MSIDLRDGIRVSVLSHDLRLPPLHPTPLAIQVTISRRGGATYGEAVYGSATYGDPGHLRLSTGVRVRFGVPHTRPVTVGLPAPTRTVVTVGARG